MALDGGSISLYPAPMQHSRDMSSTHGSRPGAGRNMPLAALRAELRKRKLSGFIIPRQDEFQGEYVAPYAERLRWLTGFAGSWGMAIVMLDRAAIFVDGRYTIQVRKQVDTAHLRAPPSGRRAAAASGSEKELKQGEAGLRSLAAHRRAGRSASPRPATRPARSSCRSTAIPIDADLDRPAAAPARSRRRAADAVRRPARAKDKLADVGRRPRQGGCRCRGADPARFGRLGVQHPRRRCRLHAGRAGLRDPARKGEAELFIDASKLPEDVARASRASVATCRAARRSRRRLRRSGENKARVQIDPDWAPERIRAVLERCRRRDRRGQGSLRAAQGAQERDRAGRRPRRPSPRRRRHGALPVLARRRRRPQGG